MLEYAYNVQYLKFIIIIVCAYCTHTSKVHMVRQNNIKLKCTLGL